MIGRSRSLGVKRDAVTVDRAIGNGGPREQCQALAISTEVGIDKGTVWFLDASKVSFGKPSKAGNRF